MLSTVVRISLIFSTNVLSNDGCDTGAKTKYKAQTKEKEWKIKRQGCQGVAAHPANEYHIYYCVDGLYHHTQHHGHGQRPQSAPRVGYELVQSGIFVFGHIRFLNQQIRILAGLKIQTDSFSAGKIVKFNSNSIGIK